MKNLIILTLFQALSSVISSILISKMSFIGRIGISTMHREYLIFKTWWKTALLFFAVQFILILTMQFSKKINQKFKFFVCILLIIIGIIGTYLTYLDFTTTSHKMMKFSFHSGFYLFWLSWFVTCLYFLFFKKYKKEETPLNPLKNLEQESIQD
ncbi:hypothetical protein [Capnocytophaga felis]|uniref:hypothetical protein n=1 Tax=Capnocytophaga felis TaxID=2267611 RepID=UPI0012D363B0|nr:hypothetical protein [Capnocytophaga felis]